MRPPQIRLVLLLVSALLALTVVANVLHDDKETVGRLADGATGLRATGLQWLLNAQGADLAVTGVFAEETLAAVRGFQARDGLAATGVVDTTTFRHLTPEARKGDHGLRSRAVQSFLNLHGERVGVQDNFDAATEQGVIAFQRSVNLDPTGVVDRRTWDALFEGPNDGEAVTEADQFLQTMAPHAQEARDRFGVPPSVAIAQSAQETGWGRSAPGNNYFGVKCHGEPSRSGPVAYDCVQHNTNEWENGGQVSIVASFRSYASMRDSVLDYGNFLQSNSRYAPAFAVNGDADNFARALQQAGYATDPAYADSLITIMEERELYRFNR